MAKRFVVEINEPALCHHTESFGTMLLPCGGGVVTADDIKTRLEKSRNMWTIEDLYFSELRGSIIVTELPGVAEQEIGEQLMLNL